MAQKVKVTTRKRLRKTGGNSGYISCNICHGSGRIKKPKRNDPDIVWVISCYFLLPQFGRHAREPTK